MTWQLLAVAFIGGFLIGATAVVVAILAIAADAFPPER